MEKIDVSSVMKCLEDQDPQSIKTSECGRSGRNLKYGNEGLH